MTERFTNIKCEFEYSTGVWTDVVNDVIGGIAVKTGIRDNGPLDKIASTGTLRMTLRNAGNAYTPGHASCTSGFAKGVAFRLRVTYDGTTQTRFYGTLEAINIRPGNDLYYYTDVMIVDYMNQLAIHELQLPEFAEDKRIDEIVPLIVANMDISPLSNDYNTGQDTFETVFDTTKAATKALQELSKVALSELGFIYVTPSAASDEVLVVEGRYERAATSSSAELTDQDIDGIQTQYGEHYYNDVKTVTYPREVDSAATSILFTLDRSVSIGGSETKYLTGRFKDPDQQAVNVAGIDMVSPVATTDYTFNTESDGSGTDITAYLTVTASYGANGVEYTLENTYAQLGYVTKLQARGKGVYTYQAVESRKEYDDGITADGRKTMNFPMAYQDDPLVGEDFASALLNYYKTKQLEIKAVSFEANKSATLMAYFRDLFIGDRINLDLDDLGIDEDFYIHGIDFTVSENGVVNCIYIVFPNSLIPGSDIWRLGDAGFSELDDTTKLGF